MTVELLKADIAQPHSVLGEICLQTFKKNNVKLRKTIFYKFKALKRLFSEKEPQIIDECDTISKENETLPEIILDMDETEINNEFDNTAMADISPKRRGTSEESMFEINTIEINTCNESDNPEESLLDNKSTVKEQLLKQFTVSLEYSK
ncbi:hypothetical protein DPMN_192513 [Dreissena polymorpha]|uniref:Uncharacterized protein n=1 Tax=Dreissena polymorpha TaxID=45954 RepID=A0A9D3Y4U6_DREPO|nr:hypothetical protein DPMN_192513 [Dreissena polymorpha]